VVLPAPAPPARALALRGLAPVGRHGVPADQLERLDELLRSAAKQGEGVLFSDQAREELGWSDTEARAVLRALGYAPIGRGPSQVWRRRGEPKRAPKSAAQPAVSPFEALAALRPAAKGPKRRRGGRRPQSRARG
jgi:ATP-dependent RNA helicase SUPV3L1/SUV3